METNADQPDRSLRIPPGSEEGLTMAESKDYTRICDKCGTRWLLPKELATEKGPRAAQVKGMERASRWGVGRQRTKYSMQALALQDQQDRVLANAMCPSCGSSDFTQYKPGQAPAV